MTMRDEGEALEELLRDLRSAGDSNFSLGFLILLMLWKWRCRVAEVLGRFWILLTFNTKQSFTGVSKINVYLLAKIFIC